MFATLITLIGFMLLAGLTLLAVGLRGRRIDDHPVCRKCRFDLSGAPEPRGKCPECGADVSEARGVRIGQRRRRPRLAGFGAFALALGLLGGAVVSWGLVKGTNWNTYKPAALLLFEARAGTAEEAEAAISEMADRLFAETIQNPRVKARLAEVVLARQGDGLAPWGRGWGKALDNIVDAGLVSEAQLEEVFRRGYTFEMATRPTAREGESMHVRLQISARLGSTMTARPIFVEGGHVTVNGVEVRERLGRVFTNGGRSTMAISVPSTTPGPAEVAVQWRYAFVDSPMDQPEEEDWIPFVRSTTTSVLPEGQSDGVELVANETARGGVRNALQVTRVQVIESNGAPNIQLSVTSDDPPVHVAFHIFVRQGDHEWRAGTLIGRTGQTQSVALGADVTGLERGPVSLIFRPSESAIRGTIDLSTAWDGEIVFEDLPVEWPPLEPERPEPE